MRRATNQPEIYEYDPHHLLYHNKASLGPFKVEDVNQDSQVYTVADRVVLEEKRLLFSGSYVLVSFQENTAPLESADDLVFKRRELLVLGTIHGRTLIYGGATAIAIKPLEKELGTCGREICRSFPEWAHIPIRFVNFAKEFRRYHRFVAANIEPRRWAGTVS